MQTLRGLFREVSLVFAALVRPAYRSIRENQGLAGLSIVLAFGLWIFVTDAENPTRTRVLPVDLPVEAENVPSDVVVANDLATVRVRVSVEENVFGTLTSADFEAKVDVDGLGIGDYKGTGALPVSVRRLTTRGGLRVEEVLPPKIDVSLVARESKEVPVVIKVTGDPAAGYTMGTPEAEGTTVTVSGPAEKIGLATQAVGSVSVEGRADSIDQAVRLEPQDDNGNPVGKLSIEPPLVNVKLSIKQTTFSRPVTVSPQITGVPADGYNIASVSPNPVTVTIRGEQASIREITTIPTQEVDVDGKTADVVKSVGLQLPPGVSVVGSSNVTVTVHIEPTEGTVRSAVGLSLKGLGAGLRVRDSLPTIQVTLTGPLPGLLALKPGDVTATVDLSGKDAGTHTVRVEISLPDGVQTTDTAAEPSEVTLTLEKS